MGSSSGDFLEKHQHDDTQIVDRKLEDVDVAAQLAAGSDEVINPVVAARLRYLPEGLSIAWYLDAILQTEDRLAPHAFDVQ